MNTPKLNTHYYDGKLKDTISTFEDEFNHIKNEVNNEKILFAIRYLNEVCIQKGCSSRAKQSLHKIIHDRSGNIDSINGLNAEILLYIIYTRIIDSDNNDTFELLNTQLDEMMSGLCPQGRCIRLLQILKTIQNQ